MSLTPEARATPPGTEHSSEIEPLDGPAEEFLARFRRGERPSLAEYERRHPEDADADRRLLTDAYLNLGSAYARYAARHAARGERLPALILTAAVARLRPDDPLALNNLAWALVTCPVRAGDPARALPLIQKAVAAEPDEAAYRNTLGCVLYRLGRYREALPELAASVRLGSGSALAADYYLMALCHHKLGDRPSAWVEFLRALAEHGRQPLRPADAADVALLAEEAFFTVVVPPSRSP